MEETPPLKHSSTGEIGVEKREKRQKTGHGQSPVENFFGNEHLVGLFLGHLDHGELLRLQSVCKGWKRITESSTALGIRCFRAVDLTIFDVPKLLSSPEVAFNTFVSRRIRYMPALDETEVNSPVFKTVRESPNGYLAAMKNNEASWRKELICWPPAFDVYISNSITAEEAAPYIHLTCPAPAITWEDFPHQENPESESDEEDSGGDSDAEDSDEDSDELEFIKLNCTDFPHNHGKELHGITFQDLVCALRKQYLAYPEVLEPLYANSNQGGARTGEWVVKMGQRMKDGSYNLDIAILLF